MKRSAAEDWAFQTPESNGASSRNVYSRGEYRPPLKCQNCGWNVSSDCAKSTTSSSRSLQETHDSCSFTDRQLLFLHGYVALPGKLGTGRYCKVLEARDHRKNEIVAVKIVDGSQLRTAVLKKFLPREVQIWQRLNHRNIVKMIDHFQEKLKWFMILEYVPNGDLLSYIQKEGAQSETQTRFWFRQLVSAVQYLHSLGVAHRDLKLENILIGDRRELKLADFGFCRMTAVGELSTTYCGSKAYSAPEILRGKHYNPLKADIWSLGVVLFILVTGRMPFNENVPYQSDLVEAQRAHAYKFPSSRHISPLCKELIGWALTFRWSDRPDISAISRHQWMNLGGTEK